MRERPPSIIVLWLLAAGFLAFAVWRLAAPVNEAGGSPVRFARGPEGVARADGRRPTRAPVVYVHVAGAVRRPGLVRVPRGSRVAEAVSRAGGPTRRAELTGVNLAAELEDGQQVVVPLRGAGGVSSVAGTAPRPGEPGAPKLSLGAATAEQLDELDGIGPTLSQRIIEYRTEQGGFRSLDELREVDGIGEKRFETLREALQP